MDIQVKQETPFEECGSFVETRYESRMECLQVVVKEEELIIEDNNTKNCHKELEDYKDCKVPLKDDYTLQGDTKDSIKEEEEDNDKPDEFMDYQYDGYTISFLEQDESQNVKDFGYLNEYSEGEEEDSLEKEPENDKTKDAHVVRLKQMDSHKRTLELLSSNYIRILCPICGESMKAFINWSRHVATEHTEFNQKGKDNFQFITQRKSVCKLCPGKMRVDSNHLLHYITIHCPEKHELFLCNICGCKCVFMDDIVRHIDERHNKPNDLDRTCPICDLKLRDGKMMRIHFKNEHLLEFKSKFKYYNCHLCNHPRFEKENYYIDHLMNLHSLYGNDWEQMNFKLIDEDDNNFQCNLCLNSYANTGPHSFLEHHLTHVTQSIWCCSYCDGKLQYNDSLHMCKLMYKFYKRKQNKFSTQPVRPVVLRNQLAQQSSKQLEHLEQFEASILHCCPYCNDEFEKFQLWQAHLRNQHFINSLDGLDMMNATSAAFRCLECDMLVNKSADEPHRHRFQHLPHMPYKCKQCFLSLENEQVAIKHVLSKCDSAPLTGEATLILPKLMDDINNWIEIICGPCKNKQFTNGEVLEEHFRTRHNNFESYYYKHENNLDMVCKRCKTALRSVSSEICLSHYVKHITQGPYRCLHCRRSYKAYDICKLHVGRFHKIGPRNERPGRKKLTAPRPKKKKRRSDDFPDSQNDSKYNIPTTSKATCAPINMRAPKGLGKLGEKASTLNEFQEFIHYACPECNESFKMQSLWNDHIEKEHTFFNDNELCVVDNTDGKSRCTHCNLVLASQKSHLQKHKLTHMPYRSFICVLCDNRTNTTGLMYSHLRRLHFSKGTFECPICLVNLRTAYERSEHVKLSHPRSEWPKEMCLICYRIYKPLDKHMPSHDINRPKYICKVCGVGIVSLKDFQMHMQRKHNEQVGNDVTPTVPTNGYLSNVDLTSNKRKFKYVSENELDKSTCTLTE